VSEIQQKQTAQRGMLPGMAAIAIFLLVVSMITGFQVIRLSSMSLAARYGTLIVCTILVVGVFGVLRLRRWGWALVSAGCVFGAGANFYAFHRAHMGQYLIQGLFLLVFFLYLSRPEVRDRLH
jgi:hypothetical protein